MTCEHKNFEARVDVNRLSKKEGGEITAYSADIKIRCADCCLDFYFLGSDYGLHPDKPTLSVDNLEMRAPIMPNIEPKFFDKPVYKFRH